MKVVVFIVDLSDSNLIKTSVQRIFTKGCIVYHNVVEYCVIPFAAYATEDTLNQWSGQYPKIAPSRGRISPPSDMWFHEPQESTLQSASRSVQLFLQGSRTLAG